MAKDETDSVLAKSEIFWGLWNTVLRIQKLKPYPPILGSLLLSMQLSVLRQLRFGRRSMSTVTQVGHHVKAIESLVLTVKANPTLIQRFKTFNNKRNKSVYDVAGAVSVQELGAMVKLAIELKDATVVWLQKFHPELLRK